MYFKQKAINIITISVFLIFISGCHRISNIYPDGDFKILVLSDIHITNSESKDERLSALLKDINCKKYPGVEMVVTCGDNVSSVYEHYYPDSVYKGYNRLQKFMDIIKILEIPYYLTMGNHEFKIEKERDSDAPYKKEELLKLERFWHNTTGFKPYYSIIHKGWKIIILNSMSAWHENHRFDEKQLAWFEKELDNTYPTLVFFHHPIRTDHLKIWDYPDRILNKEDEPQFYRILESNKNHIKGIFVGHGHLWVHDKLFDQIDVYEIASFGDDDDSPFLVIGVDMDTQKINVSKTHLEYQ